MKLKTMSLIAAIVLMAGCTTTPKPETKYVTQYETSTIVLTPTKQFYSVINRVKPPAGDLYVKGTWEQKEKLLFDMINRQDMQIEACRRDRYSIGEWIQTNHELNNKKAVKK